MGRVEGLHITSLEEDCKYGVLIHFTVNILHWLQSELVNTVGGDR